MQTALALRETLPGIGHTSATGSIAEIGVARRRCPSARQLASWAGVCPGNRQSAGKRFGGNDSAGTIRRERFGGKTRHGNTWLRALLGEVAWGEVAWSIAHTANP